jgi:ribonuclease E
MSDPAPPPPSGGDGASREPSAPSSDGRAADPAAADGPRPRRRGSRGGRGRNRSTRAKAAAPALTGEAPPPDARLPDELPERLREETPTPRDPAALVPRKPKIGDSRPAPEGASPSTPDGEEGGGSARRRRRRGGRGRGSGDGARPSRVPAATSATEEVEGDLEGPGRQRGRERKGRPVGRYLMCVSRSPAATQIAVLEGRSLIEHYVSRPADDVSQIHGNIYLGRVQNVLPGMEAAFVDIGTPKNAVLYRGDIQYDAEDVETGGGPARIEHLLRPRQSVLVQVTKNPIGSKGARLTQEVSLPGRFVVLIPNSSTYGISKRLSDDERKRLRSVLDKVKLPSHGLIVRTAAEGASREELERDVARLQAQWDEIDAKAKRAGAPALLYREPDMAVRAIREEFNSTYRGVVLDDRELYDEVRDYVGSITPELVDRVELHDPVEEPLPLFEQYHVHEQLHKALDRKVWLPSGGSLIIERTEALTVIDVNTGKNVGRSSLEETVYRNNLEAAEEVARQLRLRDIGGIIVIDFIDMEVASNRADVMKVFRDALARDKTRTQVFDISELGLVEMTRKRIGEGLVESLSSPCPTCEGRGLLFEEGLFPELR